MASRGVDTNTTTRRPTRTFPSVRTIMLVRFDPGTRDKFEKKDIRVEANPSPVLAAQLRDQFRALVGGIDAGGRQEETGPKALGLPRRSALTSNSVNLADAISQTPSRDGLSRFIDVQPLTSQRRINSFRLPSELELTVSWKTLPFDSRLIRAILVFHYEGTVTAEAFATLKPERDSANPLPTGYLVPATGSNLRFVGQVDEISDTHDENGDTLTLRCRDLRALLVDTKIPPGIDKIILPGSTIQQVIANLLATNPEFQIFRGPFLRISGTLPRLSEERYPRLAVPPKERHRADATGAQPFILRFSSKSSGEESYWDAITDLCVSHGLIPNVEKDALVLLEPRTLYKQTPDLLQQPGVPAFPRPGGHRESIGDRSSLRRMVYGSNILSLRFFRKFARIKAPAVRVTSYNPDASASQRLITVVHPPNYLELVAKFGGDVFTKNKTSLQQSVQPTGQATKVSATGKNASVEVHNVVLQGITDKDILAKVAEQVYEAMGRQEFGVTMTTNEIASYSDNPDFDPNLEPDLLDLRAGDPIQILAAPSDRADLFAMSELNLLVQRSLKLAGGTGGAPEFVDAVAYLRNVGFNEKDARALVKVLSSANIPREFRVNTAQINFDGSDDGGGFSIQIDARDYMRVRADPDDVANEDIPGSEVVA